MVRPTRQLIPLARPTHPAVLTHQGVLTHPVVLTRPAVLTLLAVFTRLRSRATLPIPRPTLASIAEFVGDLVSKVFCVFNTNYRYTYFQIIVPVPTI